MNILIKSIIAIFYLSICCLPCFASCPSMDATGDCRVDFNDFAVFANQWLTALAPEPNGMVWVSINEPNFTGQMSKYETTNAQYCQFLNSALASGDIYIDGLFEVKGANGSNSGADYVGVRYYLMGGSGFTYDGATNGGAGRIHYSNGIFTVDPNFENHPVTWVSWYGATAFCNYYGCRLPTELEWQAAADFNGSYTYGCGTTINNSIANYGGSIHPNGTTVVGSFGAYGYGLCDMAGNAYEWTSTVYAVYSRIVRGGMWYSTSNICTVSYWSYSDAGNTHFIYGFRACR